MSLFRKPKNKQFRHRARDSESEEEHQNDRIAGDQETIQTKLSETKLNAETIESAEVIAEVKVKKSDIAKSKLSFHDEEEEDGVDVFKVKKSSVSRRFAKQAERERKKQQQQAENRKENKVQPKEKNADADDKPIEKSESIRKRMERERAAKDEELNVVWVKSESMKSQQPSVIDIPAEDPFSDESADEDDGGPTFRPGSLRGVIPDAKTIYALKKQRQQRRDADEFIPLQASKDDDDDRFDDSDDKKMDEDDDEDEDGRIGFVGLNNNDTDIEKNREAFYQAQEDDDAGEGHDSGDELARWEREQISRGLAGQQNQEMASAEADEVARRRATEIPSHISRGPRPPVNLELLCNQLRDRLSQSQETLEKLERDLVHIGVESMQAEDEVHELRAQVKRAGREFEFYQILKNYIASKLPA